MTLVDGAARRRLVEELDRSFVVEAAAGTGKTTALVARMVALLRSGRARVEEMVAVTFTAKAAGELKLRLRQAIAAARADDADDAERGRLDAALAALEGARVDTIHAFCAQVLRERPVEAGVDPELRVLGDVEAGPLLERVVDDALAQAGRDRPSAFRRLEARGRDLRSTLRRARGDLVERRDHPARWTVPAFDAAAELAGLLDGLRRLSAWAPRASARSDGLAQDLQAVAEVVASLDAARPDAPFDPWTGEGAVRELRRPLTRRRAARRRWFGPDLPTEEVLALRAEVAAAHEAFFARADASLAAALQRDLAPMVDAFQRLKEERGLLDFLDLLLRTRDLLVERPDVLAELRRRVRVVLVDEAQDTDPLQAEILLLLASDEPAPGTDPLGENLVTPVPGRLVLVGDPKQSIYRFRRADIAIYERIKARLAAKGVETLHLSTSFRAVPNLQRVVNRAFAPLMEGAPDGSQARYVPLAPHRPEGEGQPSVVALPVPRPYGRYGTVWRGEVERSCPDAVGAFIDHLLHTSGWTVPDRGGRPRPIESQDICLLFRQTTSYGGEDRTRAYARALEAREIPYVLIGGRALRDREEVLALLNAARAIEDPDDALSVYATLRGPFFALTDEDLLLHRARVGPLHPLAPAGEALWDPERRPAAEALAILGALHRERSRRPVADTLTRLLDETRAHAGIANWPNGDQALANVLRVIELARASEGGDGATFRGFLVWLRAQLEDGRGLAAPVVEEGAAGVRLMTVHKAKGLEFPVVVLCDPLSSAPARPSRYLDPAAGLWAAPLAGLAPAELAAHRDEVLRADRAEEVRVAYVAATRARDLLVVPAFGDGPEGGWLEPLHRALYPSGAAYRSAGAAPGCPPFGSDSVLDRPIDARARPEDSVKPGAHTIGGAQVVWWDPSTLELGRVPVGGLRRQGLLSPEGDGADDRVEAHLAWVRSLEEARGRASGPTAPARSARAVARDRVAHGSTGMRPVEVHRVHRDEAGGGGAGDSRCWSTPCSATRPGTRPSPRWRPSLAFTRPGSACRRTTSRPRREPPARSSSIRSCARPPARPGRPDPGRSTTEATARAVSTPWWTSPSAEPTAAWSSWTSGSAPSAMWTSRLSGSSRAPWSERPGGRSRRCSSRWGATPEPGPGARLPRRGQAGPRRRLRPPPPGDRPAG
ncbi:MAG: UvrD-helicase domain-containing protein [Sandaracinaceae bacterium]